MKKIVLLLCIAFLFNSCEEEEKPMADFSISGLEEIGVSLKFENKSQNCSSYSWNFGDGTSSTLENPLHVYRERGTYSVTLTAEGENGTSVATKKINIIGTTYSFVNKSSINLNQFYAFHLMDGAEAKTVYLGDLSPGDTSKPQIIRVNQVAFKCTLVDEGFYYTTKIKVFSLNEYDITPNIYNIINITDYTQVVIQEKKNNKTNTIIDIMNHPQ
mgnify:CR=1 FL=1